MNPKTDRKHVIVLGGGITGAYVAMKLTPRYRVTVIDADTHGAGRIKSFSHEGKNYDHGAIAIAYHYDYVLPLVKKYNLHLIRVPMLYDIKHGIPISDLNFSEYGYFKTIMAFIKYVYLTSKYPDRLPGYQQAETDPALSMGTWDYLKGHGIEPMEKVARHILAGYGYSHGYRDTMSSRSTLNEIPMAHLAKAYSSRFASQIIRRSIPLLKGLFDDFFWFIQEGFEELYSKIREESEQNGASYLNDYIHNISDSLHSRQVILSGGKSHSCDALICTIPLGPNLSITGLETNKEEILSKIKSNYFGTTIFELSEEAHKCLPQRVYNHMEFAGYEPTLLVNKFEGSPVWISYNYVKALDQTNYDNSAEALKTLLHCRLGVKRAAVKVLSQRYVKYFPHPENPHLMQAMAQTLSEMQGMYDGKLYFTGPLHDFDIVEGVIRHADSMIQKHFE